MCSLHSYAIDQNHTDTMSCAERSLITVLTTHNSRGQRPAQPQKPSAPAAKSGPTRTAGLHTLFLKPFYIEMTLIGEKRCGKYEDGKVTVEVSLTTEGLDRSGFVHENEEFMLAVRREFEYGAYTASCEQIGEGIAAVAYAVVGEERLRKVHVKVYNLTGHTAFDWEAGNAVPQFPQEATDEELYEEERAQRAAGGQRKTRNC